MSTIQFNALQKFEVWFCNKRSCSIKSPLSNKQFFDFIVAFICCDINENFVSFRFFLELSSSIFYQMSLEVFQCSIHGLGLSKWIKQKFFFLLIKWYCLNGSFLQKCNLSISFSSFGFQSLEPPTLRIL